MELERFRLKATSSEPCAGARLDLTRECDNSRRQEGRCVMQRIIMAVSVLAAVGTVSAFAASERRIEELPYDQDID